VKANFQNHVCGRIESCGTGTGYSMWDLARCEFAHGDYRALYPSFDAAWADLEAFLDLSRDGWQAGAARMENIRVPVLMLNAASDPLASAQGVADLFSRQHNPNIGVILLKEGGHIGFTAYSADFYYSLMTNFFDPATAPAISGAL
jgi:pimeloyl-ACP methyl ester carboxylesterase